MKWSRCARGDHHYIACGTTHRFPLISICGVTRLMLSSPIYANVESNASLADAVGMHLLWRPSAHARAYLGRLVPRVPPAHVALLSLRPHRPQRGQHADAQLEKNVRRPEEQEAAHRLQQVQQRMDERPLERDEAHPHSAPSWPADYLERAAAAPACDVGGDDGDLRRIPSARIRFDSGHREALAVH